mmetsp:Transcript_6789/g.19060  ORF Transcript_6789/g.19060 Transcript_6789/m.19060 type:complete len:627 (-) Transcript_6789:848-2728(-)
MTIHSSSDTWQTTVLACRALQGCLQQSFGPHGLEKLVVTSGGQTIATASGSVMLKHLGAGHAITSFLIRTLRESSDFQGEGASATALMVAAAVQQIADAQSSATATVAEVAAALRAMEAWFLDHVVGNSLSAKALVVPLAEEQHAAACMRALLLSTFTGKQRLRIYHTLAHQLSDIVITELSKTQAVDCASVLSSLCTSPPISLMPGSALTSTELVDGIIIERPLRSASMPVNVSPVCLVVLGALEYRATGDAATVQVASSCEYQEAHRANETSAREKVAALQHRGVNVLICTEPISELAASFFAEAGIAAVQLVPEAEARRIARWAGCTAMSSACGLETLLHTPLGSAVAFEARGSQTGGASTQGFSLLQFKQHCMTMTLRAPSLGQCKMLQLVAIQGLTVLRRAVVTHNGEWVVSVVPGAGSSDISIAAQVEKICSLMVTRPPTGCRSTDQPAESTGLLQGIIHQHRRGCTVAFRALQAMAEAGPKALIASALGVPNGMHGSERPVKVLHQLRERHRSEGTPCRAGCVMTSELSHASPVEPVPHGIVGLGTVRQEASPLQVADAMQWGLCHTLQGTIHRWASALSVLTQLLSIDIVLPSRCRISKGEPPGSQDSSDSSRSGDEV